MSPVPRRLLFCFLLLAAGAAAVGGVVLFRRPWDGPSLAGDIVASFRLPRVAARISPLMPAYLVPPPTDRLRGVSSPWRVGIQAGHLRISELPDEQARLRGDTGAAWGSLTEAAVNLAVAELVARQLREAGVTVDLLPATVPPGYDADAFIAIHADDGGGSSESGWKVSAPWRSSEASRQLTESISRAYGLLSGLPEDRYGVSFNMRGYYAFSWTRYAHAVAPTTPAAIIETGFLTSAADRRIIVDDPERTARGISMGILLFLGELASMRPASLVPLAFPPMTVSADSAPLRFYPDDNERIAARLPAGTPVRAMDEVNGWVELVVRGNFRVFGWMKRSDLLETQGG